MDTTEAKGDIKLFEGITAFQNDVRFWQHSDFGIYNCLEYSKMGIVVVRAKQTEFLFLKESVPKSNARFPHRWPIAGII